MYILGDIDYADNYNNEQIKVKKLKSYQNYAYQLHFQMKKKEFLMQKNY